VVGYWGCMNGFILAFALVWILLGFYILKLYLTRQGLVRELESLQLIK